MARRLFYKISAIVFVLLFVVGYFWSPILLLLIVVVPLFLLGVYDVLQDKHAVLKNFPVIGHFRYMLELIRPEIQQYFIETYESGMPFSREGRSIVYQRAKQELDTLPFGTQKDVYKLGYEWINHSLAPKPISHEEPRLIVGEGNCKKPYSASLLNISAMSFGSLSGNALLAMNRGAKAGGVCAQYRRGGTESVSSGARW